MQFHEIRIGHIYLCPTCNASNPPKDKFVVIIHKQKDSIWGFFINSDPKFILSNPDLVGSQIKVFPEECPKIIEHVSYIGCNEIKYFFDWELNKRFCELRDMTKKAVLEAVQNSSTLDTEQIQTIIKSLS